jgi:menaquinone-dependent protoporphyrinogen oxidase
VRIAGVLSKAGLTVDIRPVSQNLEISGYDAVVAGSAVYFGAWSKEASDWVRAHVRDLARLPLWLFSVGPVGDKELPPPKELAEFDANLHPRDHRVFSGALDRAKLNLAERIVVGGVGAPEGDFRDWQAIDQWATGIAEALSRPVLR